MNADGGRSNIRLQPTLTIPAEAWCLTRLAIPLILASLLNMGISITDVVMMSWLGTNALAAGAAASDYYSIVFHFCAGIIAALSPFLSQALGAGARDEVGNIFGHGLVLVAVIALPGAIVIWHSPLLLDWIGVSSEIVQASAEYTHMMSFTLVFILGVTACSNFLSAHHHTRMIYYAHFFALPLNALGNYIFMFGNAYVPELGLTGVGLSSLIVAAMMFFTLLGYSLQHKDFRHYHVLANLLILQRKQFLTLIKIGLPIGVSRLSELGVYLLSTMLIGILGAEQLAAHALTLRLAGLLYAFPLGFSQGATVRAALAIGSSDLASFRRVTLVALGITAVITAVNSIALALLGDPLANYFFDSQSTSALAVALLGLLVVAHPLHGIATVCNGLLRGIKDTYVPMWLSLVAFWGVGFSGGCILSFYAGLDAVGIWVGLLAASTTFCVALLTRLWFYVWRMIAPVAHALT